MAATSDSGADTFTKVVAPSLGLILSNVMFLAPLAVRLPRGVQRRFRREQGWRPQAAPFHAAAAQLCGVSALRA